MHGNDQTLKLRCRIFIFMPIVKTSYCNIATLLRLISLEVYDSACSVVYVYIYI